MINTVDLSRRPELQRCIDFWKKEIEDNPNHPTNLYSGKELNKAELAMAEYVKSIPTEIMDCLCGPDQECYPIEDFPDYVTEPSHGGKVTCELCGGFIDGRFRYKKLGGHRYQHMEESCYN